MTRFARAGDVGDAAHDGGAHGRVAAFERGHGVDDRIEVVADRFQPFARFVELRRCRGVGDRRLRRRDLRLQRAERPRSREHVNGTFRQLGDSFVEFADEFLDACGVDRFGVRHDGHLAARPAQFAERADDLVGRGCRRDAVEHLANRCLSGCERASGSGALALDQLVLVEQLACGGEHLGRSRLEAAGLVVDEPEVLVHRSAGGGRQPFPRPRGGLLVAAESNDVVHVAEAGDECGVADPLHPRVLVTGVGDVIRVGERGAPPLDRVDLGCVRIGGLITEQHHRPVGERREPVRGDDLRDVAFDQVVRHQQVLATGPAMKDVEHVFAVRSSDQFLELEAFHVHIEHTRTSGRQVEAAGEDDAFTPGEQA